MEHAPGPDLLDLKCPCSLPLPPTFGSLSLLSRSPSLFPFPPPPRPYIRKMRPAGDALGRTHPPTSSSISHAPSNQMIAYQFFQLLTVAARPTPHSVLRPPFTVRIGLPVRSFGRSFVSPPVSLPRMHRPRTMLMPEEVLRVNPPDGG